MRMALTAYATRNRHGARQQDDAAELWSARNHMDHQSPQPADGRRQPATQEPIQMSRLPAIVTDIGIDDGRPWIQLSKTTCEPGDGGTLGNHRIDSVVATSSGELRHFLDVSGEIRISELP